MLKSDHVMDSFHRALKNTLHTKVKTMSADETTEYFSRKVSKTCDRFLKQKKPIDRKPVLKEFPKVWKQANIKILLKSIDKYPAQIKSYRPISPLPVIGKIYERLIVERLLTLYSKSGGTSNSQYGFTKGISTVDAVSKLITVVKNSQKIYAIAIFIDISKAFDNLPWASILYQLTKLKCPGKLYNVFRLQ